jgi:DNA replication protein DnaD
LASHNGNTWEWKGETITCQPGQFVTSLESLKEVCGKDVSIQNIRTALLKLEKWQFLTSESTKTGRLISIINWESYQLGQQGEQQSSQQRPNKDLTTIKKGKNEKKNTPSYSQEFERWWQEYPKKVGKGAAWRAWKSRNGSRPDTDQLIEIVRQHRQSAQWQKEGGQFIPNPATWLNQERWEDELSTEQQESGPPKPREVSDEEAARMRKQYKQQMIGGKR